MIGCGGEGEGAGFVGDLAGNWLDKTGFQTGRSGGGGRGGEEEGGGGAGFVGDLAGNWLDKTGFHPLPYTMIVQVGGRGVGSVRIHIDKDKLVPILL